MQPKYTHNKSNIIKITEDAKRKSRQRLIGSIVLLFFALVILLNITAKVKPIPINPEVVEIKNAVSGINQVLTLKNNASGTTLLGESSIASVAASATAAASLAANTTTSSPLSGNSSGAKAGGFKAGVINREGGNNSRITNPASLQSNDSTQSQQQNVAAVNTTKPKAKAKPAPVNPADILDGLSSDVSAEDEPSSADNPHSVGNPHSADNPLDGVAAVKKSKNYLQFAALSSQSKAEQLQQELANHGINASVQPIQTDNGTLYRLRAGPFSRSDAQQKLQELMGAGYKGIITGN